jgi:BolA protein
MAMVDRIEAALRQTFTPEQLEIVDESEQHRGHGGFREGVPTHFRVRIHAPQFAGMTRLARHRAVHTALGAEILNEIHALALEIDA